MAQTILIKASSVCVFFVFCSITISAHDTWEGGVLQQIEIVK